MIRVFLFLICVVAAAQGERPAKWAKPESAPGMENLHRVTPIIFRSAQPTAAGLREMERRGVKTIINLRHNHDDTDEAAGTKLRLVRVKMNTWHIEDEDVALALAILREKKNAPFLVHCQHGSDRTGIVCAMFRIVEQGWSREEAIREMREGGYGFHAAWRNIVRYLEKVDVEKMRRRVEKAR